MLNIFNPLKRLVRSLYKRIYKEDWALFKAFTNVNDDIVIDGYSISKKFIWDYRNVSSTVANNKHVVFIDIGANNGHSARLAYFAFPHVSVISYKPLKSLQHHLENVKEYHNDFIYEEKALSFSKAPVVIHEMKDVSGLSSMLKVKDTYSYFGDNPTQILTSYTVSVTVISEEIQKWEAMEHSRRGALESIKILKIDTQGTELSILQEGREYLSSGGIGVIMIEVMTIEKYEGQHSCLEMLNFLDQCGFVIFTITPTYTEWKNETMWAGEEGKYGQTTEYDMVFVHKTVLYHKK